MLEARSDHSVLQAEDGEERRHDAHGPGDDDPGDNARFAVRVAFANGIGSGPYFDDAPEESEHQEHRERQAETVL